MTTERHYFSRNARVMLIVVSVLAMATLIYLYSYDVVLGDDELWYAYVMDTGRTGHYYDCVDSLSRPIGTLYDVVVSQIDHYHGIGGRSLVHGVEQYFTGVSSPSVFYVLNALVFLSSVFAIAYLGVGRRRIFSLYPWLIILVVLLYCLAEAPLALTSINRAPNYLWPMLSTSIFLYLWHKYNGREDDRHDRSGFLSVLGYVSIFFLGLLCGWTHEGYTLPVCGALFFYYLTHIRAFRGKALALTLGLWIAGLLLLLAPGNFVRMGQQTDETGHFGLHLDTFLSLTPLFVALACMVATYLLDRRWFFEFLRRRLWLLVCFALSTLFCWFTYGPRVDIPLYYFLLLLVLTLFRPWFGYRANLPSSILWIVVMLAIIAHWSLVVAQQLRDNDQVRAVLTAYQASPDGLVPSYFNEPSALVAPYLRRDFSLHSPSATAWYGDKSRPLMVLPHQDFEILQSVDKLKTEPNRLCGTLPLYHDPACSMAWATAEDIAQALGIAGDADVRIGVEYAPVSFDDDVALHQRILRALMPARYPRTDTVYLTLQHTRWGDFYYFPYYFVFTPVKFYRL